MGAWIIGEGWQAAEGRRSLDLNDVNSGSIQQVFYTPPRTSYLVTFALAGNPGAFKG